MLPTVDQAEFVTGRKKGTKTSKDLIFCFFVSYKCFKKRGWRDGTELKTLATLVDEPSSESSVPTRPTAIYNSSFKGSDALFWTQLALGIHMEHMHAIETFIYTN